MATKLETAEECTELEKIPVCADLDEDCDDIEDHLNCWLYDIGRGRCPWCSMPEEK